eukprot:8348081-Heterocapsa_arctica.AAC.1
MVRRGAQESMACTQLDWPSPSLAVAPWATIQPAALPTDGFEPARRLRMAMASEMFLASCCSLLHRRCVMSPMVRPGFSSSGPKEAHIPASL